MCIRDSICISNYYSTKRSIFLPLSEDAVNHVLNGAGRCHVLPKAILPPTGPAASTAAPRNSSPRRASRARPRSCAPRCLLMVYFSAFGRVRGVRLGVSGISYAYYVVVYIRGFSGVSWCIDGRLKKLALGFRRPRWFLVYSRSFHGTATELRATGRRATDDGTYFRFSYFHTVFDLR